MTDSRKHGFTFEIGAPEGKIRTTLAIPHEPIRLSDLARAVMPLDDQLVQMGVKKHLPVAKAKISCAKGCGSCCNQLVPISTPEAFMLHDLVAAMPESRQEGVLERFIAAEEVHEEHGIDETTLNAISSEQELRMLLVSYHRLGIPCPFLEEGSCSIYRSRPSMCREYLVTSPAENCSRIGETVVTRVPVSIRMSLALAGVAARVLGGERLILPFTLAIAWAEAHEEEGLRRFDGYSLMNMLLEELSSKTD
jgi:Fe-S-cluster containining protein